MAATTILHAEPLVARASSKASSTGGSNSASGLIATLVPTLVVAVILVCAFLILRVKAKRIYQPRTYVSTLEHHEKTPIPSTNKFGWIGDFLAIPDEYVLSHHSLDGYLYLRFYRMIARICFFGMLLTWPILMPVYATAGGTQKQFDKISYANASRAPARAYAPAIVGCIFFGLVAYFIGKESIFYTCLRPRFLLSPQVASRISARTVLFTNVPVDQRSEDALRSTFGQVKQVWLAADSKSLQKLKEDIDKTTIKLEGAEVKLCKAANKQSAKYATQSSRDVEDPMRWADDKKRPTHRLKFVGKKVDTINWCRDHLAETIPELETQQKDHARGHAQTVSAAFVEFHTVEAAEAAFRNVGFQRREKMVARSVGVQPSEVVWENLGMSQSQHRMRHILALLAVIGLLLIWAPLTAFIGLVSNVQYIAAQVKALRFITSFPPAVLGIITGLLPVIALAVLMMLVPIIMRKMSKFAGAATLSEIELDTQSWYYIFQVVIVFLITTFSSGAAAVVTQIVKNPKSAVTLLAQNLPKASNFYIDYFVLNGIGSSAKLLSNAVALIIYVFVGKYLDTTPRKVFQRYTKLPSLQWGSVYPPITMLAGIAITYSCIAPLILLFSTLAFYLLYWANRYNLIYTLDASTINQQGAGFEKALNHLFVGIYIAEICLIGLFAISLSSNKRATGALVIMLLCLIVTIIYQILLARTATALRKSLAHEMLQTQSHQRQDSVDSVREPEPPLSPFGDHAAVLDDEDADTPVNTIFHSDKWETMSTHADDIALRSPIEQAQDRRRKRNSSANPNAPSSTPKDPGFLARWLAPRSIPQFDPCLNDPVRPYTLEQRRLAYLHPAVSAPAAPLVWIPADKLGIAEREAAESGKVVKVTTEGAWWSDDGKGKLETVLDVGGRARQGGQGARGEAWAEDGAREAPIWEERVEY